MGDREKIYLIARKNRAKEKLSEHFRRGEFACHCGCGFDDPIPALIEALEGLRAAVGARPIHVDSGCRCEKYNRAIGGVRHSQHILGRAADIKIQGLRPEEIAQAAAQIYRFRSGGIGVYDDFIHLDVRIGGKARWGKKWR